MQQRKKKIPKDPKIPIIETKESIKNLPSIIQIPCGYTRFETTLLSVLMFLSIAMIFSIIYILRTLPIERDQFHVLGMIDITIYYPLLLLIVMLLILFIVCVLSLGQTSKQNFENTKNSLIEANATMLEQIQNMITNAINIEYQRKMVEQLVKEKSLNTNNQIPESLHSYVVAE